MEYHPPRGLEIVHVDVESRRITPPSGPGPPGGKTWPMGQFIGHQAAPTGSGSGPWG